MSAAGCIAVGHASSADIADVMLVMGDSFDPVFGEAWTAIQCTGLMQMPGVWLAIARDDGEPVGFTLSRLIADEAELLLLAVRRTRQRDGVGALLLREFIGEASRRGAARLHLEVRDGNPALRLYAREGFRQVGRRPGYYSAAGRKYDALTLAKSVQDRLEA